MPRLLKIEILPAEQPQTRDSGHSRIKARFSFNGGQHETFVDIDTQLICDSSWPVAKIEKKLIELVGNAFDPNARGQEK